MVRAALIQLNSSRDIQANLSTCRRLAEQAAQAGATWIVFPENASFLGKDQDKLAVAETLSGPQVTAFCDLANDLNAYITLGSFPEKSPDPRRTYNTQVHINPGGEVEAAYRKIHLFDITLDEATSFQESASVYPGDKVVHTTIIDSLGQPRPIGLTICYDLRFPELYRELQTREVQAITVPSAFTRETGRAHWHALLQARAIENQCYILAPNQWGHHYGSRYSFGQSAIYDPWGQRVACASDRVGFILADLDFAYIAEIRRAMPVLAHRKPWLNPTDEL